MGLRKISKVRNYSSQSKGNKLSAAATETMLCLCHCNGDFVQFNMAPFTILPKFGWLVY